LDPRVVMVSSLYITIKIPRILFKTQELAQVKKRDRKYGDTDSCP